MAEQKKAMGELDKFMFEIIINGEAAANYDPKLIGQQLAQLHANNSDGDKKIFLPLKQPII